jgi:hypothetical protein
MASRLFCINDSNLVGSKTCSEMGGGVERQVTHPSQPRLKLNQSQLVQSILNKLGTKQDSSSIDQGGLLPYVLKTGEGE